MTGQIHSVWSSQAWMGCAEILMPPALLPQCRSSTVSEKAGTSCIDVAWPEHFEWRWCLGWAQCKLRPWFESLRPHIFFMYSYCECTLGTVLVTVVTIVLFGWTVVNAQLSDLQDRGRYGHFFTEWDWQFWTWTQAQFFIYLFIFYTRALFVAEHRRVCNVTLANLWIKYLQCGNIFN